MKMLRKLMVLLLALILAFGTFACNRAKDSSVPDSSSSIPEPPRAPQKVERPVVSDTLNDNLMDVTLNDVVGITNGEVKPFALICDGLMLGDIAKLYISDFLFFDYYDDGQWRLSNGTVFGAVPNAIFSYEFGSGQPLALTETQLALYGNNTVLSCFSDLFAMNLDNMVALNGNLGKIVERVMDLTVQELYNLTAGDYQFVIDEIMATDLEIFVGVLFEILEAQLGIEVDYEVLNTLINGTVADPSIDAAYLLSEILPLVVNQYVEGDIANLINYVLNHISADIEADGVVDSTIEEILLSLINDIYEAEVVPFLTEYGEMTLEQADTELFNGMLTAILPESVKAHFDAMQATLNAAVEEILGLLDGSSEELIAVLGALEIEELAEILIVNLAGLPGECVALITSVISGTIAEPMMNEEMMVSTWLDGVVSLIDASIEGVEVDEVTMQEIAQVKAIIAEIKEFVGEMKFVEIPDAIHTMEVDDVFEFLGGMLPQDHSFEALAAEAVDLLQLVFDGTLAAPALNTMTIDKLFPAIKGVLDTVFCAPAVDAVFADIVSEYGEMTFNEFIQAYYEDNAETPIFELPLIEFVIESNLFGGFGGGSSGGSSYPAGAIG